VSHVGVTVSLSLKMREQNQDASSHLPPSVFFRVGCSEFRMYISTRNARVNNEMEERERRGEERRERRSGL